MTDDPTRGVHLRHPLRCHIFGHRWQTFDHNWCGTDYQICQRMGFFPLKICGAVRNIKTAIADTRPKDGDALAAPLASGGGAKQSPKPLPLNHHRR